MKFYRTDAKGYQIAEVGVTQEMWNAAEVAGQDAAIAATLTGTGYSAADKTADAAYAYEEKWRAFDAEMERQIRNQ